MEGPKTAKPIAKIVDGIVAVRNPGFEREGDCIQLAVGDAHTPDVVMERPSEAPDGRDGSRGRSGREAPGPNDEPGE